MADVKKEVAQKDVAPQENPEKKENVIIRGINPSMLKFNVERDAYNKEGEKTGKKYKVTELSFTNPEGAKVFVDVNPKDVRKKEGANGKATSYSIRFDKDAMVTTRRYPTAEEAKKDGTFDKNKAAKAGIKDDLSKSGKLVYEHLTSVDLQKQVQDASHAILNNFKARQAAKEVDAPAKAAEAQPEA
jgi:hypothetical protein